MTPTTDEIRASYVCIRTIGNHKSEPAKRRANEEFDRWLRKCERETLRATVRTAKR